MARRMLCGMVFVLNTDENHNQVLGPNVKLTSETCMAWVSPQRLTGRWQPEMFRAEYLELDQFLSSSESLVEVRDLVQLSRKTVEDENATWHVEPAGIKRRFPSGKGTDRHRLALPEEAILVCRNWFNKPSVCYWNTSIYRGNGTVSDNFWVLTSTERGSIAWLKKEFESPYIQLQMKRKAIGEVIFPVAVEDFLDIRVRVPSLQLQSQISRSVIEEARHSAFALRSGRIRQSIELNDESHEERLRSLERFLVEQGLFDVDEIFYVEPATNNRSSDLFTVRSCESGLQHSPQFTPQDDPLASELWRDWFWNDTPSDRYKVFNSFLVDSPLPTYLLMYAVCSLPQRFLSTKTKAILPNFSTFRDVVLPSLEADIGVEEQEWARTWLDLQQSFDPIRRDSEMSPQSTTGINYEEEIELFTWSRLAYRPILAVRVLRDEKVVGAYLLVGKDQVDDPESAYATLDDVGVDLSELLAHSSSRMDEVLRRESSRRLSEAMHRLSGPILNATDALQNIGDFLEGHPEIANQLVPNEYDAKESAAMNGDPTPDAYRMTSQLSTIGNSIEQIRNLAQRFKTLARVEETLYLEDFSLRKLFTDLRLANRSLSSLLSVSEGDCRVHADRDLVYVAIDLVIDNAVRELHEQQTTSPRIEVTLANIDGGVELRITDNALPVNRSLRHDVLQEGVSTYFRAGKGSGYGLAIVRRTFERHGSKVSLDENCDKSGIRLPGVTFRAILPNAEGGRDE